MDENQESNPSAQVIKKAKINWDHYAAPPYYYKPKKAAPSPELLQPITQEAWDELPGKGKWDSIVALRGPDLVGSDPLKWFTTSVVRHRLSKVMRVGGLVNPYLGFVLLPHDIARARGNFDIGHFIQHVQEAATWLAIPICYISRQDYQDILLANTGAHYVTVALNLLSKLDEPFRDQAEKWLISQGYVVPGKEASDASNAD